MTKPKTRKTPAPPKAARSDRSLGLFALILGCFFVSGLTGLVYEIL